MDTRYRGIGGLRALDHVHRNPRSFGSTIALDPKWQDAIDSEGFALKLSQDVEFDEVRGFLPALLADIQSGFECYHDDSRELMETYADTPNLEFGRLWKHALSFRWGSLPHEGIAAFMAATAYARATGGVVFDPQDGNIMTPTESREVAYQLKKHAR